MQFFIQTGQDCLNACHAYLGSQWLQRSERCTYLTAVVTSAVTVVVTSVVTVTVTVTVNIRWKVSRISPVASHIIAAKIRSSNSYYWFPNSLLPCLPSYSILISFILLSWAQRCQDIPFSRWLQVQVLTYDCSTFRKTEPPLLLVLWIVPYHCDVSCDMVCDSS